MRKIGNIELLLLVKIDSISLATKNTCVNISLDLDKCSDKMRKRAQKSSFHNVNFFLRKVVKEEPKGIIRGPSCITPTQTHGPKHLLSS